MQWLEYFETLNWYLKDVPETGNFGNPHSRLNETMAVRLTNQIRDELCLKNPERFRTEYALTISSPILSENNKVLTIPSTIAIVYGIKTNVADDYKSISATVTLDTIRKRNDVSLYNEDGWTVGNILYIDCALFPVPVAADPLPTVEIDFPRGWELLLQLCVVQEVKNQSGEEMQATLVRRLDQYMMQWLIDAGRMREVITLKNRRAGIGS